MGTKKIYAVMVFGKSTPSVTYDNYEEAENEAKRLVLKERTPAYVLQAVALLELNDVVITSLT